MRSKQGTRPLLSAEHLSIAFRINGHWVDAVRDVSLTINHEEIVALVGESGSGKSTTGSSFMGLLPDTAKVRGDIVVHRKDDSILEVVTATERTLRRLRGNDIAMIFQEPMSSLNPIYTIGYQIAESLRTHRDLSKKAALTEALRLLTILGVPSPQKCLNSFPHQLSGGMRQRVMIAMALSGQPSLLIADEPTTALDVTIQAQIVDLLRSLQRETRMAILFVSHDLGLVRDIASRILVMYAGQIVEEGPIAQVFSRPRMPYTQALMQSRVRLGDTQSKIKPIPGSVPNLASLPSGCSFHTRCPHMLPKICDVGSPALEATGDGASVRCYRWREIEKMETGS
jgi:oligopeptide/dipeptide ABC transporter ATP-binding protein